MRALPTRKLDRRITRVWRLSAAFNVVVWSLVVIVPLGILALVLGPSDDAEARSAAYVLGILAICSIALALILFIVCVVIVPKVRWIQWSFEVLDEEIDIHKGIFWHKRIIIPLIRVQNVDTKQGPIMRANGLASFTVATAAGEHEIPGLEVAEADALRDHVAVLARIAQEDV
ncbi:MAG: PH domain-containing protein [Coriobacteriales bacterium]|jgi:membrane protein YdbS with pleckstrin-like domain|nr:PH domain-containing protein [Coriobacteriales bacterium]